MDEWREAQGCARAATYRIAVGPQRYPKVLTLLTLRACAKPFDDRIAKIAGFALHGSMAVRAADQRPKLERPYRYISSTAIAEQGLSPTRNGNVLYQLEMPYRDGTMHFIFDPFDFIARLAALAS